MEKQTTKGSAETTKATGEKKRPMGKLVFDLRWHEAIQDLHGFDRLEMYEAICGYAKDGTEPDISDPMKRMALRVIFDRIDEQRDFLQEEELAQMAERTMPDISGNRRGGLF